MKFPKSQPVGVTWSPDGRMYSLHFFGEDEGAAVVTGPVPEGAGKLEAVPEVYREVAVDADDARRKLAAWQRANGFRQPASG